MKIETTLRFSEQEANLVKNVLKRLDSQLFGTEFFITKLDKKLVQVSSVSSGRNWHFQSRDFFLGHLNAIHEFTSGTLFELK